MVKRKAYSTPAYRLGQRLLTAVEDSSDPDEVYPIGGEILIVDAVTEIELAKLTVEGVAGATIEARVSWLNTAVYGG